MTPVERAGLVLDAAAITAVITFIAALTLWAVEAGA